MVSIELKYSLRMLMKKPLFTALTVMIVAIGLGLTLYSFVLLSNLVFKPLYMHGETQIIAIEGEFDHNHLFRRRVDPFHVNQAAEQLDVLESHSFYTEGTTFIGGASSEHAALYNAQKVNATYTSWNVFDLAGVQPILGRSFAPSDTVEGAEPVVVLSYEVWQNYFSGDENIVNQSVELDATPSRIIGVMPQSFAFPEFAQIWQPLSEQNTAPTAASRMSLFTLARLKQGVSLEEVQAGLEKFNKELAISIEEEFGWRFRSPEVYLTAQPLKQASIAQYYNIFIALFVVVFLILLLACINVSNLLLARVNERIKEVAIRMALGIPRKKLVLQMLWESVVICSIGGVLALLFAAYGMELTNQMFDETFAVSKERPFWWVLSLDTQAVAILVISILSMVLITGLIPALKAISSDFNAAIRDGSRGALSKKAATTGKALVVSEIVLSCVVLVLATVLLATGYYASKASYGVETESRLTSQLQLPPDKYPFRRDTEHEHQDMVNRSTTFLRIKEALEALAPITKSSMMTQLPGRGEGTSYFEIEGRAAEVMEENPYSNNEGVLKDSWQALGIEIIDGRDFDHRDAAEGMRSIIVNESIARDFFPNESAVGKRVRRASRGVNENEWFTIVGVVSDTFHGSTMRASSANYNTYHAMGNWAGIRVYLAAHYTSSEAEAIAALNEAVASVDPDIGIYHVQSYDNLIKQPMMMLLNVSKIFLFCGLVAVILAASGIYAMAANNIIQRTQEIGVRRAVGASDKRVMLMFIGQASMQLLIGLTIGIALSLGLTWYMSNTIIINPESYGIALVGVPSMIIVMVLLATYIPTKAILQLEPSDALHYD